MEQFHYFTPSSNKKQCKTCQKIYSECMSWVDLFIIEGPKERSFYGKAEKNKHVTDLFVYELISTMKNFEKGIQITKVDTLQSAQADGLQIAQIESTKTTSTLLNKRGVLTSWGINPEVEKDLKLYTPPKIMNDLNNIIIVSIACGDEHVIALESEMYVWSWGDNTQGQLGKTDYNPSRVPDINNIVRIAAGQYCSYAVNTKGILFVWGKNTDQVLGVCDPKKPRINNPTELDSCSWNVEIDNKKKNYYKTSNLREIEISGITRTEINSKKYDNDVLTYRIQQISKKVDFLEDETVSQGIKHFGRVWEKNNELIEISKLREKEEKKNQKIKQDCQAIRKEIKDLEESKNKIKSTLVTSDQQILDEWTEIKKMELEIDKLQKEKEALKYLEANIRDEELLKIEPGLERAKKKRKEKHGYVVFLELEREKLQEEIEEINNQIESQLEKEIKIKNKKDRFIFAYKQMEAVMKKEISENSMQISNSKVYNELIDIMKIHQAIKKSDIVELNIEIAEYSYPQEIINISNRLLSIIGEYVAEKFQRSGLNYTGKVICIWAVINENIIVLKYLNKLRMNVSSRILELTNKPLEAWDLEANLIKQKKVNQILKDAGIEKFVYFEDLTSKVNAKKLKKLRKGLLLKLNDSKK
jgi:alpha-tubulin suppressor-like RCC1 family protein